MLRIGELASYVGVSTRTVRFYHQRGLLPEPERTPAGYRLYDADAILRLSRIVALASAGVPLARIHDLLEASEDDFAAALTQIDTDLGHRIRQLKDDRARLKRLRAGDALTLPDVIVRFIEQLRRLGLDPVVVDHYRDS
ncbi:MerR family transcriptional regulator [Aeromicrobium sp. UC242_57]|uniref:MerR family transcriptional regulator n=1 Tax=Aeromicrobium sp. UC242_57 TaxID=3374624 RepID=UPI00378EA4C4